MGKAAALREEAIAKFREADALVASGEDAPKAEDRAQFDALFADGTRLMDEHRAAAAAEGNVRSLRETLSDVGGAVRGQGPIPFQSVSLPGGGDGRRSRTMGGQFVESTEYQALQKSGVLESNDRKWVGEPFRPNMQAAATDVINSGTSPGGGALVTPQYLPGVIPLPQRPLTIDDLLSHDTTQSDTLSYARQTSFDTAAAPVAQATSLATGLKPQSAIGWTRVTTPIESIATGMAATRRQLADAGQTRSLIDNQLSLMLDLVEEDQLLNGNGTSPNLRGILATTGVQTLVLTGVAAAPFINIDGIRDAIRLVRTGAAFAQPNGIVMNPTDAAKLDEAKDTQARYLGQGPFNPIQDTIWRLPRVESLAITAGTALVGAFKQGATVFQREDVVILTADQHSDFFIRNLVAVLAEERLGLAVFFPAAFCLITFKTTGWANA
jgi:HK97 family phage major capsid protein